MVQFRRLALIALLTATAAGAVVAAVWRDSRPPESPRDRMPPPVVHVDHGAFFPDPLKSGPDVTRACLRCHPNAALDVMKTSHWTWAGQKVKLPGRDEVMQVGAVHG